MSINRRTAIAVRSIGVVSAAAALALGVGGTAFACQIGDFTANVSCDTSTGKADVKVTDTDTSGTPAHVSVYAGGKLVGEGDFAGSRGTSVIDVPVPWQPDTTYRVHVHVQSSRYKVDADVTKGDLTTNGKACAAPTTATPTPTPSDSTTPPATTPPTTATASPTPTASTTSPAPAVGDTNAPSPAAGAQNLAETGGGSNTGMIAGIAAALVAAGGGAVFMLRRKAAPARH